MLQIPELLAPAGDAERLRYAINYGADAVYCGLPEFGMRSAPANFTPEQLAESVIYAHARGRKIYLTMNTLPTNEEADRLPDAIKEAAKAGVDAFIVADLGVLDACKTVAPDIDVHMSTQTGITNWAAARARATIAASPLAQARCRSSVESAESTASAILLPTPCTAVSRRNQARSAPLAKPISRTSLSLTCISVCTATASPRMPSAASVRAEQWTR